MFHYLQTAMRKFSSKENTQWMIYTSDNFSISVL